MKTSDMRVRPHPSVAAGTVATGQQGARETSLVSENGQRPDVASPLRRTFPPAAVRQGGNVRVPTGSRRPLSTLSGLLRPRPLSRVGRRQPRFCDRDHGLEAGAAPPTGTLV